MTPVKDSQTSGKLYLLLWFSTEEAHRLEPASVKDVQGERIQEKVGTSSDCPLPVELHGQLSALSEIKYNNN